MKVLFEIVEGMRIALAAVRANKLRSSLATLGIVIGVVTVTLMGTAIQGLNSAFMESVSTIGADVLYVQRQDWIIRSHEEWRAMRKRRNFTVDQAERIGLLIECQSVDEAHAVLKEHVEQVPGILGAWPVFSHFE